MRLIPKTLIVLSLLQLSCFTYAGTPVQQAQFLDANQESVTLLSEDDGTLVVMKADGTVLLNQAGIDWLQTVGISLTVSASGQITPVELTKGAKVMTPVKPASQTIIDTLKKAQTENLPKEDLVTSTGELTTLPPNQQISSGFVSHHFSGSTGSTVTAPNVSK